MRQQGLPSIRRYTVVLAVFLAGCQFLGAPDEKKPVPKDSATEAASVNPYLLNRPSVPDAAAQRFAQAVGAVRTSNWTQAEADLQWLTTAYPTFSGSWLNLATVYIETGRPELAEQAYTRAIAANATNVQAYNLFAVFLREQGRFGEAETIYRKALSIWPDHPDSHKNLAILYDLYMGRLSDAAEHYHRYLELTGDSDQQVQGWLIDLERRL